MFDPRFPPAQLIVEAHACAEHEGERAALPERLGSRGSSGGCPDGLPDGRIATWQYRPVRRRVSVSDEMSALVGLTAGAHDLSLSAFLDRFRPQHRERIQAALTRGAFRANDAAFEVEATTSSGEPRSLRMRIAAAPRAPGRWLAVGALS